jgi:fatty-acyl-CoA synthase
MTGDLSFWLEKNADFTPEKVAIRFEGEEITYQTFAKKVRGHARTLKHIYGVGRGDRVAFLGMNHPDLLYLFFACARVGAMFLPLNWRLAAPEHLYILKDATAKVLICDAEFEDHANGLRQNLSDCEFVSSDFEAANWHSLQKDIAVSDGDDSNPHVSMETPFLLVYTSGTTGRPKGAVLTQHGIQTNALNSIHYSEMTASDHILTALPMFHVGGLNIQTTPAFYCGATVTIHRRFNPAEILRTVQEEEPTLLVLVPATLQAVIGHPQWMDTDISSIRMVNSGSSMVPLPHIKAFHDRGVPVSQVYGSTETGPVAVYQKIENAWAKPGSAGKAAMHCEMRIIDDADKDVEQGQSGEILLKGGNILFEYWGNEAATKESLRDGWFYTGDIGYQDEDGDVWINDRKKDVVISGGENIYPAEIEAFIHEMADIVDAVVVGKLDEKWGEVPVAVAVLVEGTSLSEADFLARFQDQLARFKHPKGVIFVEDLPRNAMGKVLKYEVREMVRK